MGVYKAGLGEVILEAIGVIPSSVRKGITQILPVWTYGRGTRYSFPETTVQLG